MLELFKKGAFVRSLEQVLMSRRQVSLENLWDTPIALIASILHTTLKRSIVLISPRSEENRLIQNIKTFLRRDPLEFPSWEVLPTDDIAPNVDIMGKRLEVLARLCAGTEPELLITSMQSLLQRVISPQELKPFLLHWEVGKKIPFDSIATSLEGLGYVKRPLVCDKGEFAIRGGIIDLFPVCAQLPYRIEFFGDAIEQIRSFDPGSQKSIERQHQLRITPASEQTLMREGADLGCLLDYLDDPILILDDLVKLEDEWVSLQSLVGAHFLSLSELLRTPALLFCSRQSLNEIGSSFAQIALPPLLLHPFHQPSELPSEGSLLFLSGSESEKAAIEEKCQDIDLPADTRYEQGYLSSGIYSSENHLTIIPYSHLTGRHKIRRQQWRQTAPSPSAEFHALEPGDYVVHLHNGIGRFLGVEKQAGHEVEFIVIQYAENGKLYVPLSQAHLVSRYIGAGEAAPDLHTIGSTRWEKAKLGAQKAIIGYAKDLLTMQAERAAFGGFCFPPDSESTLLFEEEFPFVETADQLNSIAEIKKDMTSPKPMDRLVCGDVGYGKTEVAMRAACKAVLDGGKQVAVLVPTTTLAMQHYETFCERMQNFPIRIKALSRFIPRKEIVKNLESLASGGVDIIIGTHRIISSDVIFKDLGLIIVDEEQRFGVRAKEHLKKLKTGVDCLTLSATPIPRTLYMSIVGARDLSVINTPPQDRLPIKTILAEHDAQLIKNACLRELMRGGQVYYIHNRIETIYKVADNLQQQLPEARIKVGHGQMDAEDLDEIFHAFKSGQIDILVATTIVESGIDIPNANTILIDRADTFGLADLYQLRGRVGRWNRPAYAYFLTPPRRELPQQTQKRLHALAETSGFGGGMKLAMRDLEIRGAGDLLGLKQSGQVASIGFHLYCKLLKKTIEAIKKNKPISFLETKMEFPFDASIPEFYVPEASLRLELYHRLGESEAPEQVEELRAELIDRFGPLPSPTDLLLHLTRIRIYAAQRGYSLLKYHKQTLTTLKGKGEGALKKAHILPFFKTPAEFEAVVLKLLSP